MSADRADERTCTACGKAYLLPSAERQFRQERGLGEPAQCPDCRGAMRAARNAELIGLYQRSDALGFAEPALASERRPAKGGGRSPGRVQEFRQRYNTVCAACGSETQVPFVPRGDRPVYCRDCFNARKGR